MRRSSTVVPLNGARFSHSTASSIDETCQIQKPPTSSFVSANGPSMTRLPPSSPKSRRLPSDDGVRPSPASMIPALSSSSLYLPIAANSSSCPAYSPFSLSSVALTSTITRI